MIRKFGTIILIFAALLFSAALGAAAVKCADMVDDDVNDFANVINIDDRVKIEKLFKSLNKEKNIAAEVLTIESVEKYSSIAATFDELSEKLLEEWNLADTKQNKVLIILSIRDHDCRIVMNSKMHFEYSEMMRKIVINEMFPYFTVKEYSPGIYKGCESVVDILLKYRAENNRLQERGIYLPALIAFILCTAGIFIMFRRSNKFRMILLVAVSSLLFVLN